MENCSKKIKLALHSKRICPIKGRGVSLCPQSQYTFFKKKNWFMFRNARIQGYILWPAPTPPPYTLLSYFLRFCKDFIHFQSFNEITSELLQEGRTSACNSSLMKKKIFYRGMYFGIKSIMILSSRGVYSSIQLDIIPQPQFFFNLISFQVFVAPSKSCYVHSCT